VLSVDHTKLADGTALSNVLRKMSGEDKNVQIDGNVIVAKVPRENWRMMAKGLQTPGIGKCIAEPVLIASLPWVVADSNSRDYESGGGTAVEFRHEELTVRIRPLAVVGTAGIKLEATIDHKLPHKVDRNAASLLQISSGRTIDASGELTIGGDTLVISLEP